MGKKEKTGVEGKGGGGQDWEVGVGRRGQPRDIKF